MIDSLPLKRIATVIAGQSPPSSAVTELNEDLPFLQGNAEFGDLNPVARFSCPIATKVAEPGDILMSVRAPVGALNMADKRVGVGRGLCAIRPRPQTDRRFLWWAMHARRSRLIASAVGSTYDAVTADMVGALRIPAPPLSEQRAIADYLDTETTRIDALIVKKRRMCVLVVERAAAEIRHRLLSAAAPWLPLKRRWQVVDCKHRTPSYRDEGYPVVSPGDATPGRLDLTRAHRFVDEADFRDLAAPPRRPKRGDIIYSRNASIGIASYVDTDQQFCMGQDVCLITSTDQNQLFLSYALNTVGVDQLEEAKIGSTFSRVNIAQILEVSVPCPEPAVQAEMAVEFDQVAARIDVTVRKLTRQVELLVEHRQALITAAVTGELTVPGAA